MSFLKMVQHHFFVKLKFVALLSHTTEFGKMQQTAALVKYVGGLTLNPNAKSHVFV